MLSVLGTAIRYVLLAALVTLGAWFGLAFAMFAKQPEWAILAYSTDAFPQVPASFAGGFLRWAPYDPNARGLNAQPLIHFAGAGYGQVGSNRENAIRGIRILVARGADINARSKGLTPLHEAILISPGDDSLELVRVLLELGADPELRVSRPGEKIDGMSAAEFAEYLEAEDRGDMGPVIELIRGASE